MTAKLEWYAPEQRPPQHPDTELAHQLGNRVMILAEELREVRDECERLRKERDGYRTDLNRTTGELVRLTRLLLEERGALDD